MFYIIIGINFDNFFFYSRICMLCYVLFRENIEIIDCFVNGELYLIINFVNLIVLNNLREEV